MQYTRLSTENIIQKYVTFIFVTYEFDKPSL